jgi:hypothetical protein
VTREILRRLRNQDDGAANWNAFATSSVDFTASQINNLSDLTKKDQLGNVEEGEQRRRTSLQLLQ